MRTETSERVAEVYLTRDEAIALLALCLVSIKSIDQQTRDAIEKLTNYCRALLVNDP